MWESECGILDSGFKISGLKCGDEDLGFRFDGRKRGFCPSLAAKCQHLNPVEIIRFEVQDLGFRFTQIQVHIGTRIKMGTYMGIDIHTCVYM